jgi:hypothetical protein
MATSELENLKVQLMFIDSSISLGKERLNSLRTDIEGALGKRNKYDEYIVLESNRIDSLEMISEQAIIAFDQATQASEHYYDSLVLELERFTLHYTE